MSEILVGRILGAIRFVDISTNAAIRRPLRITAERLSFARSLSGDYAITRAADPDLLPHLEAFRNPPAIPAIGIRTFFAHASDPGGEYLARDFSVSLPRDPNPANAATAGSLFRPVEVAMLSSPNRAVAVNWCVVRVSVENAATHRPIPRAGIRVTTANPPQTVFGMTDASGPAIGEALVALAGLPFHTVSQDPNNNTELVLTEIDATLVVFAHKQGGAVWPELIAANDSNLIKSDAIGLKVAPGRAIARRVEVAIPNP